MSKNITVCVSGASIPEPIYGGRLAAMDYVRTFWTRELSAFESETPDLVLVPECCDRFRGLTPLEYKEFCCLRKDDTDDFFRDWALKHRCVVGYCANRVEPDGRYVNALRLIGREGTLLGQYCKAYPTSWELEEGGILPGNDCTVVETEFGRIGMSICFDLNFDALFNAYAEQGVDVILFSSVFHGGWLQACRAAMAQAYFIGAVSGERCSVLDPQGVLVAESSNYIPRLTAHINLDCRVVHYDNQFEKLEQLKKKYGKYVTIRDPGRVGSVLVTCEKKNMTIDAMLNQFGIVDYATYRRNAEALADAHRNGSLRRN